MNDRQLIDDTHSDTTSADPAVYVEIEEEQPTPCPEILIELARRVSALEDKIQAMERK